MTLATVQRTQNLNKQKPEAASHALRRTQNTTTKLRKFSPPCSAHRLETDQKCPKSHSTHCSARRTQQQKLRLISLLCSAHKIETDSNGPKLNSTHRGARRTQLHEITHYLATRKQTKMHNCHSNLVISQRRHLLVGSQTYSHCAVGAPHFHHP